jgi:hypothetical protein
MCHRVWVRKDGGAGRRRQVEDVRKKTSARVNLKTRVPNASTKKSGPTVVLFILTWVNRERQSSTQGRIRAYMMWSAKESLSMPPRLIRW